MTNSRRLFPLQNVLRRNHLAMVETQDRTSRSTVRYLRHRGSSASFILTGICLFSSCTNFINGCRSPKLMTTSDVSHAGGGGERVLWEAIRVTQHADLSARCVVYQGDTKHDTSALLKRAKERFGITLERPVEFLYLSQRYWVEDTTWPRCTLLGQSMGSIVLGAEALFTLTPHIFIDTMGFAFTYPLFRFIGDARVLTYTHYPVISTDMLDKVWQKQPREDVMTHQTGAITSSSAVATWLKYIYYHLFAYLYASVLACAHLLVVNSTWTFNHVNELLARLPFLSAACLPTVRIIYPPCQLQPLLAIPLGSSTRRDKNDDDGSQYILSVAQFRPEKGHMLQIKAFARFVQTTSRRDIKLVLLGGCRAAEDEARVEALKMLAANEKVDDLIIWEVNASYATLQSWLRKATCGLHTMWNEHFGIGVVEYLAAGLVTLAHASGGPMIDIIAETSTAPERLASKAKGAKAEKLIKRSTGFLAADVTSFAQGLEAIFQLSDEERSAIQLAGREHAESMFSDATFQARWQSCLRQQMWIEKKGPSTAIKAKKLK